MSEIAGGGGSGGGGEAAVLSLKINTGTAGTDLMAIGKALDDLARPRGAVAAVSKEQTALIAQQRAELAQLSNQLQKVTADNQRFAQGSDTGKVVSGLVQAKKALDGVSTSSEKTAGSFRIMLRSAEMTGTAAVKTANDLARAKNAANNIELRVIRQEEAVKAREAAKATKELWKAKNDANTLELKLIRQEEIAKVRAAAQAIKDLRKAQEAQAASMSPGSYRSTAQYRSELALGNDIIAMMRRQEMEKRRIAKASGLAGAAAQQHAAHVHALNLGQQALHATLRGVTGVLGGLWLSYAKLVPVLLAAAAATKAVKDSVSGGLDTTFQAQFIATVDTSGLMQGANLKKLRDEVLKDLTNVARDSVFSVEQNADALKKLSLAGVEASRGIGLLETATNAAIFAQKGLGETTGMILDTLYNFNLASGDAGVMADNFERVADIMSYTAITVNAGFDDIAKSFQNVVGVAGSFNIQIEEAAYLLQNLAQAGIRGQKAGTYVRNFLDDLLGAPISRRAEAAFAEKGIERFDASKSDEYAASKYIDSVIAKVKNLGFIEQQDFLRAVSNQRSRRVWRQELLASYDKEATMLSRVSALAEKAEGSLAKMAEGLKGSGKYALQMAQSAYNAAGISAFQSVEADDSFAAIGKQLQTVFNSKEYASFMESVVRLSTDVLQSLTNLFDYLVQNGAMIRDVLSGAFDLALLGGFAFGITKAIGMLKAGFIALAPVAAMLGKALVGAFSGIGLAISAAIAKMLDFSTVAAKAAKVPPVPATAPVRMSPANAAVGLGASALALGAGLLLIREVEIQKLDHSKKTLRDVSEELAEIQRRIERINSKSGQQQDYTGFDQWEMSGSVGLLAREKSLLAAKSKMEEARSREIGDGKAKTFLQTQIADVDKLKETYNQAQRVLSAGLLSPEQAGSLAAGASNAMLTALEDSATKIESRIKELQAEYQTLMQVPEGSRDLNRIRQIEQESDALRRNAAELQQTYDDVRTAYTQRIDDSIFSHLSSQAADLGLKGSEAVSKTSGEIQKALADITSSEEGLAIRRQQSAEVEARMMVARAASLREQADRTSDPELVRFLLDQAKAADEASTGYARLAKEQQALIDGQAWASGKGPMTEALLGEFDTNALEDYAAKLKQMNDLAGLTTEALQEMTIAAAGMEMAKAFEEGDIERGNALAKTIAELNRQFSLQGGAVDSGSAAREKLIEQYEAAGRMLEDFIRQQNEASGISRPLTSAEQIVLDYANQYGEAMAQMSDADREYRYAQLESAVGAAEFAASLKDVQESLKDTSGLQTSIDSYKEQYIAATQGEEALRSYQYQMALTAVIATQTQASLMRMDAALEVNAGEKAAQMLAIALQLDEKARMMAEGAAYRFSTPVKPKNVPGDGGPDRSKLDAVSEALQKAKTDVEEFKNAYQEAMAGIGERESNFEIGPLEAYALSVSKVSDAYGEMLATIDKAKAIPNLKGSQAEKLDTDRAKLVGEQNKELAKLNRERIEEAWDLAAELQKAEVATGNLVLGAAEAWLMEFGATYGEAISKVKLNWDKASSDLASAEVLLEFAVAGGGSVEEIARLKAEVARLKIVVAEAQDGLTKFQKSADLGSWAVGLKEDLEKGERALEKFAREVEKAGEASEKGGLFGMLFQGTTAKYNDAASKQVAAIRGEISKLQTEMAGKPFNLEFQGKLEGLERELEDALANTDPTVQAWSDNFGSAIANAIVYGFEEGESPAKVFANMLKQELTRSLTQVFSQNFTVLFNMVGNMMGGGGSGGVAGAAQQGSGLMDLAGNLKTGWDYASKGLNWLTGASAAAPAFAVAPIASAFAPATTIAGGLAGGVGTTAFSAGTSALVAAPATSLGTAAVGSTVGAGAAAGGGFMSAAGAALPWVAGGLLLASAFGLFDKKPSNKAAGGTVDLGSGATTTWEMQGKKAPDQGTKDARDSILGGLGAFGNYIKSDGSVAIDVGGRDGIQAAINGSEMKSYGKDGNVAMQAIIDELVLGAKIDPSIISAWEEMKTAIDGTTRSAADNMDVMGLLTSGVGETDIERAQIIKASNESLGQSYAKLAAIMGINESASDQWRQRQHALQDGFSDIGLSMPATIDGFRELANSIDLTTEDGRKLYNQLMGLGPAFLEAARAIEQTMEAISGVGKDSIESIKRSVMTDAEEYAYNDSQLVVGREKYAELIDPASIQANFDKNMELINASWSLIPEEIKKSLVPQFETIINDETRLANDRLSLVDPGYAPVVSEPDKGVVDGGGVAEQISAAIGAALTTAAAGFSAAGDKQGAAAATFAAAAASIPARIVVQSNVTVSASEIGR